MSFWTSVASTKIDNFTCLNFWSKYLFKVWCYSQQLPKVKNVFLFHHLLVEVSKNVFHSFESSSIGTFGYVGARWMLSCSNNLAQLVFHYSTIDLPLVSSFSCDFICYIISTNLWLKFFPHSILQHVFIFNGSLFLNAYCPITLFLILTIPTMLTIVALRFAFLTSALSPMVSYFFWNNFAFL